MKAPNNVLEFATPSDFFSFITFLIDVVYIYVCEFVIQANRGQTMTDGILDFLKYLCVLVVFNNTSYEILSTLIVFGYVALESCSFLLGGHGIDDTLLHVFNIEDILNTHFRSLRSDSPEKRYDCHI